LQNCSVPDKYFFYKHLIYEKPLKRELMDFKVVLKNLDVAKLDDVIRESPYTLDVNLNYFRKILVELSKTGILNEHKVYITRKINTLPEVGDDVIVLLLGDEWCRYPDYLKDVKAVIKCYGVCPASGFTFHKDFNLLQFLSMLNHIRTMKMRLPSMFKHGMQSSLREKVLHIPLGYYKQEDVSRIPIKDREIDIYFAGSVAQYSKLSWKKKLVPSPKTLSRIQMLSHTQKFSDENPECRVQIDLLDNFLHGGEISKYPYSERLMNSKICLVPRGTSFETFRFFEALRSGCIVICEDLPEAPFYDGAPAFKVYDWKHIHKIVPEILKEEETLERMHKEALEWWENRCSEDAVIKMIHSHLEMLNGKG